MRSLNNTVRLLAIVMALSTLDRVTRFRLAELIDGYDIHNEDAYKRRMYADISALRDAGFRIDGDDCESLEFEWPHQVVLTDGERSELFEAAVEVGERYFLEAPLRLAVYKLTRELLPTLVGPRRAVVGERECAFVTAALRSAISGRAVYARGSRAELSIHGLVIHNTQVHAITAGERGRARCRSLAELHPSVGKTPGTAFHVRSKIDVDTMLMPTTTRDGISRSFPVNSEGSSRQWTLAQAIRHGDIRTTTAAMQLSDANDALLAADLLGIGRASIGAGEYLLFPEHCDGELTYDSEMHSDLLSRQWPLTPLEAQAVYGALALAGNRRLSAAVELASGISNRIYVADRKAVGVGLVEVAA